ncbi:MAG: hypothetical protein J0L67_01945 [Cytophagales bacterium]|nr:hypothetical protein [Cytophagales bacterium]
MANPIMIEALRRATSKLAHSNDYQWGHMGLCNCGFLAQQITALTKSEIHSRAMLKQGDWSEQLNDYCPTSGLPMDELITELLATGFTRENLQNLERLADPEVLRHMPGNRQNPKHNVKQDVILYINTWATCLENELLNKITLPEISASLV